jgi:hypothetical protein
MSFEVPGVRFSGKISLWEIVMRTLASSLVRPLTQAVRHLFRVLSRPQPAEFSAATHTAFQRSGPTLAGPRAADRASADALRPHCNSVNTEDLYGISITREKLAAPTRRRRFPTEGRRSSLPAENNSETASPKSFWDKIVAFFGGGNPPIARVPEQPRSSSSSSGNGSRNDGESSPRSSSRRPESVEVTTPRLYVGNLSFEATESDLFELFNGVGQVQNAEVVTYKHNQRSKGFAFVQMNTVEEAQRAVTELHDKEFLGRKLLVSGAKSSEHSSAS